MFKHQSNMVCNNTLFNVLRIPGMHPSMEMLYRMARETKSIVGQSAVARAMVESPQTVKNWERRGISKNGAIKAQALFGCNANELLATGKQVHLPADVLAIAPASTVTLTPKTDKWIVEAIEIMQDLDEAQKQAMVARMREFKQFLGPPRDGQALQMAG